MQRRNFINKKQLKAMWVRVPALIAAVMLLAAIARLPYGYYRYLRFVVCGAAAYTAYIAYRWQKLWAVWLLGFMAILFNPVMEIHLPRRLWQIIDVVCVVFLIVVMLVLARPSPAKGEV